jgi:DNA-binding transcriptional regulator YhcF (GntR family)
VKENFTWIKLYRKLLDWEWYSDTNTVRVFIHLLLKANYEDKVWRGVTVKRGSYITSLRKLAKETGLSLQQIRNTLSNTQATHDTTQSSTRKYTIITINNYDRYQQGNTQVISKATHRATTTKEYIRNKEIKNIYNTLESVGDNDIKEIAEKYQVSIAFVSRILEELKLYCGSTGKKYADYKLTLMAWVRRKTDEKPNSKLKDLEPVQILDIRKNPEKIIFYQRRGYDTSRMRTR